MFSGKKNIMKQTFSKQVFSQGKKMDFEEKSDELPNFFTTVTSDILYSRKLNAEEKILYIAISSLTKLKGYCYASNHRLAKWLFCAKETISRRISSLEEKGFIKIKYDRTEKNDTKRSIYLTCISEESLKRASEIQTEIESTTHIDSIDESIKTQGIDETINTVLTKPSIRSCRIHQDGIDESINQIEVVNKIKEKDISLEIDSLKIIENSIQSKEEKPFNQNLYSQFRETVNKISIEKSNKPDCFINENYNLYKSILEICNIKEKVFDVNEIVNYLVYRKNNDPFWSSKAVNSKILYSMYNNLDVFDPWQENKKEKFEKPTIKIIENKQPLNKDALNEVLENLK
jgi:hypothetical protein